MLEKLQTAASFVQKKRSSVPQVGLVLGSGLGAYVDQLEDKTIIPYSEIPYFHNPSVEGHAGRLILGKVGETEVAILQGRLHCYEGYPPEEIVFPIRLLATLGIEHLILTNAAGGINPSYTPGDLVIIEDHINLQGQNPLIGKNISELGPRFPDMTMTYDLALRNYAKKAAKEIDIDLRSGVYASVLGPTYETPAEVKMIRILGADMVGMSTVPEAIAAAHLGLKILGISCITNMAAGISQEKLMHEDIKDQALKVMDTFSSILTKTIGFIQQKESE